MQTFNFHVSNSTRSQTLTEEAGHGRLHGSTCSCCGRYNPGTEYRDLDHVVNLAHQQAVRLVASFDMDLFLCPADGGLQ